MNIKFTNRIVMEVAKLKNNVNDYSKVGYIERMIDGGIMVNGNNNSNIHNLAVIENSCKGYCQGFSLADISNFTRLSADEYVSNPYIKNIKIGQLNEFDENKNRIYTENTLYIKNELCLTDMVRQNTDFTNTISFGMFDKEAPITVLRQENNEDNFVWMSVNPMEIKTMEKPINKAKGKVLVLGGGLGYCSYMMSLKENVESVTIIEKNKIIYDFLKRDILPQMNKKISIINEDAFSYMERIDLTKYDYVFEDIWEDNITGCELYQNLIKYENKAPNSIFEYWIEDAIIGMIRINVLEYISAKIGGDEDFLTLYSKVAPELFKKLEADTSTIERPEQIYYYLDKKYIKEMLKKEI